MAGLSLDRGRWVLTWGPRPGRSTRKFTTEGEALEFAKANALTVIQRSRGRGVRSRAQVIDHLAANFEIDADGCWVWTGTLQDEGYARMTWKQDGHPIRGAHRIVLHAIGFPVPRDKVVDHLCRNRACINPEHLEVVQQRENVMRSPIAIGALNAAKTHCSKGHEFTPENTYTWVSPPPRACTTRICRACNRAYRRQYNARREQVSS